MRVAVLNYSLLPTDVEILQSVSSYCGRIDWVPQHVWLNGSRQSSLASSDVVDIFPDLWYSTAERRRIVKFSHPIYQTKNTFAIGSPP